MIALGRCTRRGRGRAHLRRILLRVLCVEHHLLIRPELLLLLLEIRRIEWLSVGVELVRIRLLRHEHLLGLLLGLLLAVGWPVRLRLRRLWLVVVVVHGCRWTNHTCAPCHQQCHDRTRQQRRNTQRHSENSSGARITRFVRTASTMTRAGRRGICMSSRFPRIVANTVQWSLSLHPLLGHPQIYGHAYIQGQVRRPRHMDARADGLDNKVGQSSR